MTDLAFQISALSLSSSFASSSPLTFKPAAETASSAFGLLTSCLTWWPRTSFSPSHLVARFSRTFRNFMSFFAP